MAEVNKELATELKGALKAKRFFVFINGPKKVLLVSRKKPGSKEVKEAKDQAGGGALIQGIVKGEDGVLVFQTKAPPPGGLDTRIKQAIKTEAGLTMKVDCRQIAKSEDDEDDDFVEGAADEAAPTAEVSKGISLVELQKCRLQWDTVRKQAHQEIGKLQKAILVKAKGEPDFADIAGLVKDFEKIKQHFDTALIDKLDEALNAQGETRAALNAQAAQMIQKYQNYVASNPLLKDLDDNPFVPLNVQKTLTATLADLASRLKV